MKILRVKLQNLNSLRGRQEVDFEAEPLRGAGLFAITGPTGAGKSTVLDAITLALYGKAARYGAIPSPEDMMSRHCGECTAEVVFQVPSGVFRAEWQLHRARGRADGKVQAAKRYVYDSMGQPLAQNVRETEELIEKLVGLDYPRFLRSALLAQGEFAQFLKARPDERAELLESLTGTSTYSELGTLAHTETVRRENELSANEASIRQIQLLPEEQRQKLSADITAAEETFQRVKKDLQQANDLLNKASNLAGALEQEKNALSGLQTLARDREKAASDLQRLSRHRLTIPFHGDLARMDEAEKAVAKAGALLDQAQRERSDAVLKAHRSLCGYRRMVNAQLEATKRELKDCREKIGKAVARKANAEKWLKEHKSDKDLPERLADLVSDLADLRSARKDLEREWTRIRKLAMKLDRAEAEGLPSSAEDLTKAKARKIQMGWGELAEQKQATVSAACKKAEDELKRREENLAKAQRIAGFEEHRASLKKGEPCPLCGAKEHPFAEGSKPSLPFKELERLVEKAKAVYRNRDKELEDLKKLQADLQEYGEGLQAAIGDCSGVLEPFAKALRGFSLAIPAVGNEDETKSALQQRATAYRKQTTEAEDAERDRAASEADRKRLDSGLASLNDKQSALASESLPELSKENADVPTSEEALPRWPSMAVADKDWGAAKADLTSKSTTLFNREADGKRLETDFSNLVLQVSTKLPDSAFKGIEDLKAARLDEATATRVETVENSLKERGHRLEADLRASRESIAKWRKESAPEGEALAEVKVRQPTLQLQHDQTIRDLTTWKNQLSQDDENRRTVAGKQKDIEADRQRLEVWRRLRGLIGSHDGRTFRRYAQGISLDVLIVYANRHLFRLSDRYRLQRREGEELDLEIEDLHQAGAIRPMASLSGGESFLASLALALGLSDIAGRNVRIESLFIDEGFGSLDSETLDVAISALETLRQDNKTIGVISHVDLLKERIATQIMVEKQSAGTSVLRVA